MHDNYLITLNVNCTPVKMVFSIQTARTIINLVSYTDFISPLDCSHSQFDTVYFDLRSDFDLVPHTFLLHKLSAYGLSDDYLSCLHSCITSCYSFVRIHGIYSTPFEVLSGILQGTVIGALLLNDLCNSIKYFR